MLHCNSFADPGGRGWK